MKRFIAFGTVTLFVIGIGTTLTVALCAKQKYDAGKVQLESILLAKAPLDDETNALLADIQTNWTESHSEVDGPHSMAIETLGLKPTVANLTHVMTDRLPEFSFIDSARNVEASAMGAIQATILPVSVDGHIYVSGNNDVAMVRCGKDAVYVFRNESSGLRETLYRNRNDVIEQVPPNDDAS